MDGNIPFPLAMKEQTAGEEATSQAIDRLLNHAEFAQAGITEATEENGERLPRGIFCKVRVETPV